MSNSVIVLMGLTNKPTVCIAHSPPLWGKLSSN